MHKETALRNIIKNQIDNLNLSLSVVKILASITLSFFASFTPGLQVLFAVLIATSLAVNACQAYLASMPPQPSRIAKAFPKSYEFVVACYQQLSWFFSLLSFQKNIALLFPYLTAWLHILFPRLTAWLHIPITPFAIILGSMLFIMHKIQTIMNSTFSINDLSKKIPLLSISRSTIDGIAFTLESTSTFLFLYLTFSPITFPLFMIPLTMIGLYALCKSCEPSSPQPHKKPTSPTPSASFFPFPSTDRQFKQPTNDTTPLLQSAHTVRDTMANTFS